MPFHSLNFLDSSAIVVTTPILTTNVRKCSAVTTGKHRAQEIDRDAALQSSKSQNEETNGIPFTLTYQPQNLAVKNVINILFSLSRTPTRYGKKRHKCLKTSCTPF